MVETYSYGAYGREINEDIIALLKEGTGIRSMARLLKISVTTVLKRILAITESIQRPTIAKGKTYEVDEMRTFAGRKSKMVWIAYALERTTKGWWVSASEGGQTKRCVPS